MDTIWFQSRIKTLGKSQRALAHVLGIDPAQVTNLLKGRRRMQLPEAAAVAAFLNVSVEDVLQHAGLAVSGGVRRVKLAGYVDEHGEIHLSDRPEGEVDAPALSPDGTIAVRMKGDQMLMRSGVLFFAPGVGVNPDAIGRLSVARVGGGPWPVRTISPGLEPGRYDLAGPARDIVEAKLSAASPVLWIRP